MGKITQELLNKIMESSDIKRLVTSDEDKFIKTEPHVYLNDLLCEKKITVADVAKRSELGEYVYKIFAGSRNGTRDILTAVSLGMGMSLQEAQTFLRLSAYAQLDPRNRRDSVLIYALNTKLSVMEVNEVLNELEENILTKKR